MLSVIIMALLLIVPVVGAESPRPSAVTWTGWFSDKQCARVRPDEEPRPNGTACVKKCLGEGSPAVFISEQAKAVYEVRDYPAARDDVGFRVEITGDVDEKAKTVSVTSVKRLSEVTAMCLVPKKRGSAATRSPSASPPS
jgi:hypothetical protein